MIVFRPPPHLSEAAVENAPSHPFWFVRLLKRRVIVYLSSKFKFKAESGKSYMDKHDPTEVYKSVFDTPVAFHAAMPRGTPLPSYDVVDGSTGNASWTALAYLHPL